MNCIIFPQAPRNTNTAPLRVVTPVGRTRSWIDDDRAGSRSRRSDGAPMREALWTIEFEGQRIGCELRYLGKYGVEYRLFHNNEFFQGRGFRTREPAVHAAATVRRQLENDGWSSDQEGPTTLNCCVLDPVA